MAENEWRMASEHKARRTLIQSRKEEEGRAASKKERCAARRNRPFVNRVQPWNRFPRHSNGVFALLIGIYYNWCSYLVTARDKPVRGMDYDEAIAFWGQPG